MYQDVNGNPIQYFDGKTYHSLQADYIASPDGTVMYYVQPPSTYDQSTFNLAGDYDLYVMPGDEWRYYLVSGMSSNMTSQATFAECRAVHRLDRRFGLYRLHHRAVAARARAARTRSRVTCSCRACCSTPT